MAAEQQQHTPECGDACATMECEEVGVKRKTGTTLSTLMHILTAMVGAGVLAMPQAVGYLGWIAGPAAILSFFGVSLLAADCLASVFEVNGVQHPRYYEAVRHILGKRAEVAAMVCQLTNVFLVTIAYIITASISMKQMATLVCGSGDACFDKQWAMSAIFGGTQLFFAQLPNLEESAWVSYMGAATAITYSSIALGLSISKVAQGNHYGTISGIPGTPAGKAFACLNALGSTGFAFSFSQVLLEIQDTIAEPPESKFTMRKAAGWGLSTGVAFYLMVSVFGYLAFGSAVPGDILEAFDNPKWLVIVAHVLVILHMLAAYNVFAQTFFLTFEGYVARLLGVRHPAEEAALQAAAAILAAHNAADALEKAAKDPSATPLERPSAVMLPKAVVSVTAQVRGGSLSVAGSRASSFRRRHSGGSSAGHRGVASREPSGDLRTLHSATFVPLDLADPGRRHSGGLSSAGGASQRSLPHEAPAVHVVADDALAAPRASRSPSLIHAHASFGSERVVGVGGPYRMSGRSLAHPAPGEPRRWRLLLLTTLVRMFYVAVTTFLAVILPFFSQMTGLIGSLTWWPLTIFFPFRMYLRVYDPPRNKVRMMYAVMGFMLLVAAGATVASIRNIIISPFDSIF